MYSLYGVAQQNMAPTSDDSAKTAKMPVQSIQQLDLEKKVDCIGSEHALGEENMPHVSMWDDIDEKKVLRKV